MTELKMLSMLAALAAAAVLTGCASSPNKPLSTAAPAVPAVPKTLSTAPAAEFELKLRGRSYGWATLYVDQFRTINDEKLVNPQGPLVPVVMYKKGIIMSSIEFAKLMPDDGLFYSDNNVAVYRPTEKKVVLRELNAFLVFCHAGAQLSKDNCYTMLEMRVKTELSNGKLEESNPKNTAQVVSKLNSGSINQPYSNEGVAAAYFILPERRAQARAEAEMRAKQIKVAEESRIKEREREAKDQRKMAEADRLKALGILKNAAKGTNMFCAAGKYFLASSGAHLSSLRYECDLTGTESYSLRELLDNGWDIVTETRTAEPTMTGGIGYAVNLRMRKM